MFQPNRTKKTPTNKQNKTSRHLIFSSLISFSKSISQFAVILSGAAHGLSSILQMLLCFPDFLKADPMAEQDIRHSIDFLLSLEQPNHNYAPAMDDVGTRTRPESQDLVHWCHGAPGKLQFNFFFFFIIFFFT